jgi:hypothetical protein
MQARLSAVQQSLLWLLVAALGVAVLARPQPANRRYMRALDELAGFRADFERAAAEKSLLDYALAQGRLPLDAVRAAAAVSGTTLQVPSGAPALQPMAAVQLATLAELRAHALPPVTLEIGVPSAQAIAASLSWRLAELGKPGPFALSAIELAPAAVDQADIELEQQVLTLRQAAVSTQSAADGAAKQLTAAEQQFEARRKWKLPWKALVKFDDARKAARATLTQSESAARAAKQRYQTGLQRAQRAKPAAASQSLPAPFAIARVSLLAGSEHVALELPVALARRAVVVPPLPGATFEACRAAGLWDELKGLDPERALTAIRAHFNWHYRYVEPLGVKLGGMTVLQLLPCILPLLLGLLLARVRAVGISYNPFHTKVHGSLPRVGFKNRPLDALVLVLLPAGAGACAAAALLMIGQVPVLPVLAAIASLLLGGYAFGKLGELQNLVEDVVRSHSNPPADAD